MRGGLVSPPPVRNIDGIAFALLRQLQNRNSIAAYLATNNDVASRRTLASAGAITKRAHSSGIGEG
jgi:hypothetical protein